MREGNCNYPRFRGGGTESTNDAMNTIAMNTEIQREIKQGGARAEAHNIGIGIGYPIGRAAVTHVVFF